MALPSKQVRETRLHFIDARIDPTTGEPLIMQIGHDNEDLSRDVSWDTESTKVVTGVMTASTTRGEETMTVDPFYARRGDPVSALLMHIDEKSLELDDIKRRYYESKLEAPIDDPTDVTVIYAFSIIGDVKPTSFGGPADNADAMPFEMTYSGAKEEMDFNPALAKDIASGDFSGAFIPKAS